MSDFISELQSESYWIKSGNRADYPKLEEDIETEIAVVGAGIAGILTAYQLLKEGKKVALFESCRILNGTTGHTTAKLSAQHGLIYADLIERYGAERAELYYEANKDGIDEIKRICRELDLGKLVENETVYTYTNDSEKVDDFKKEKQAYDELGIKGEYLEKTPLGFDIEAAVSMKDQGIFHSVEFLNRVLEAGANQGLKVYENTRIDDMDQQGNDSIVLKDKNGNQVNCQQVVFTTHYPLIEKDDHYHVLWARTTQNLAYKTDKKIFEGAHITYDTPSITLRTMEYFGDHFFLIGGQSHPTGDGYSDEERYEKTHEIARELFGVEKPAFKWSTHDLMSPDNMPFIGRLHPDVPNAYTITGLNAWGLANSSAGAILITDLISKRKNAYADMYDPYREIQELDSDDEEEKSSSKVAEVSQPDVASLKPDQMTKIKKDDKNIGVYKDKNGKVHSFDLSCTHAGCELGLNDGDKTWDCPCHGSRFDKFGRAVYSPAIEDLPKMNIE